MEDNPDYFSTTFSIEDEDHTLANTLRFFLNKNPHVAFCGYSMPHPSEELVNIRIQTTGEVTSSQALKAACEDLSGVCTHMRKKLKSALAEYRTAQASVAHSDALMEPAEPAA